MGKLKILLYFLLTCCIVFIISHLDSVKYGIQQASGQVKIIWNTEKIAELKKDSSISDSLLKKFELIDQIRNFASDSLGLEVGTNYTTFYDQKGEAILWNVTASKAFKIEAYKWCFPIAGCFPYKGFFNKERASAEKKKLDQLGYDTELSEVSAWSTLGILSDPVLSSMFNRSVGKLAELIIHESTHATIYLKDSIEFNENLANFIGKKGADNFLIATYGKESTERKSYKEQLEKNEIFKSYMRKAIVKLKSNYATLDSNLTYIEKMKYKQQWIDELKFGLKNTNYFENDSIANERLAKFNPNNAYFTGFSTYSSQQEGMELLLENEFNGNLKSMIQAVKLKGLSLFN
tara:strand:+ start:5151 stop:6194 length:1044 start_codon:yes stop_codon:yes gene_type:complete